MVFIMKKTLLTKKRYHNFHHINIEVLEKTKLNLQKNFIYFHVHVTYLLKCHKCKGTIQVLASSLKNHKIINATLEFNVKTS